MANLYKGMAGSPITSLSAAITSTQTSITVDNGSALPDAPNICTIVGDSAQIETILYTAKSGDVLSSVTRGVEGTAKAWDKGTKVARYFTAYDQQAIIDNFAALAAPLEWHTAELQNGWTGSLQYAKNVPGQAMIKGVNLNPGTAAHRTVIATVPATYKPIASAAFGIVAACGNLAPYGAMIGILLDKDCNIRIVDPLAAAVKGASSPLLSFQAAYYTI